MSDSLARAKALVDSLDNCGAFVAKLPALSYPYDIYARACSRCWPDGALVTKYMFREGGYISCNYTCDKDLYVVVIPGEDYLYWYDNNLWYYAEYDDAFSDDADSIAAELEGYRIPDEVEA